jgi:hypothetical protein
VRRVTLGISARAAASAFSRDNEGNKPPMGPDDANGRRAPEDRLFRVLVIAGENGGSYECPTDSRRTIRSLSNPVTVWNRE